MTREQMEAWCALEGLTAAFRRSISHGLLPRVIYHAYVKGDPVLQHNGGGWTVCYSNHPRENYVTCQWEDLPPDAYKQLTVELLTQLKKS